MNFKKIKSLFFKEKKEDLVAPAPLPPKKVTILSKLKKAEDEVNEALFMFSQEKYELDDSNRHLYIQAKQFLAEAEFKIGSAINTYAILKDHATKQKEEENA